MSPEDVHLMISSFVELFVAKGASMLCYLFVHFMVSTVLTTVGVKFLENSLFLAVFLVLLI